MMCQRCKLEIETCDDGPISKATLGLNINGIARFREGKFALRTERLQPFWLCLDCAKELQKWVANEEKK